MTIQGRIKNLQALPEHKKKIVFFSVIIVVGLVLLIFSIKGTKDGISKIGYFLQTINLPPINMPDYKAEMPNIDLSEFSAQLEALSRVQTAEFKEYKNEEYGFEIKHPESWAVNTELISKDELNLARSAVEKKTAGIHLEIISQTEKITSPEAGIEKITLKMKDILVGKREITVGGIKDMKSWARCAPKKHAAGRKVKHTRRFR